MCKAVMPEQQRPNTSMLHKATTTNSANAARSNSPISSWLIQNYTQEQSAGGETQSAKPKRPLSAYNLFFKHERARILADTPSKNNGKPRRSHGKIGFADLARNIASKWNSMDDDARSSYVSMAAHDKERYNREIVEWKSANTQVTEKTTYDQSSANLAPASHKKSASDQSNMCNSNGHPAFYPLAPLYPIQRESINRQYPVIQSTNVSNVSHYNNTTNLSSSDLLDVLTDERFSLDDMDSIDDSISSLPPARNATGPSPPYYNQSLEELALTLGVDCVQFIIETFKMK